MFMSTALKNALRGEHDASTGVAVGKCAAGLLVLALTAYAAFRVATR
jgi:hypothetical protein